LFKKDFDKNEGKMKSKGNIELTNGDLLFSFRGDFF
jgi:hypothetical protein